MPISDLERQAVERQKIIDDARTWRRTDLYDAMDSLDGAINALGLLKGDKLMEDWVVLRRSLTMFVNGGRE